MSCPFCELPQERIWIQAETALAVPDGYPLCEGHTLVLPRRHVASLYDLSQAEQALAWELVAQVRAALKERHHPDSFNIGIKDGAAAGQTVPHAHIHVIPRFAGDVADPRGGVRWVLPWKADYWSRG
jgi:diadenosine tetraphosphate (Ap4A) HIT family hydrolase